jgi:hypothetical protein
MSTPPLRMVLMGGNGAAAAFSPLSISGLVGWWDLSDLSTLWKDTARSIPVTANGDVIKGITDKSPGGHHLSQATNGPTYVDVGQNGRSLARFNGTSQNIGIAGWAQAQPVTLICAAKGTTGTSASLVGGTGLRIDHYGNVQMAATTGVTIKAADSSQHVFAVIFNGASSKGWVDGGAGTTGNPGTSGITVGAFNLGGSDFEPCDHDEVLMYDSALSLANINAAAAYLNTKWALSWVTGS